MASTLRSCYQHPGESMSSSYNPYLFSVVKLAPEHQSPLDEMAICQGKKTQML